jgi:hypothetical protein
MNPGVSEEAGTTARSLIDALKGNPGILALSVLNMALLIFMFYALHGAGKYRETLTGQVFENTRSIHDILLQRSVACPEK